MTIKGVLFDSGETLVGPKEGDWWPPTYFRRIVAEHGFDSLAWDRLGDSLSKGMRVLDRDSRVLTEADERAQFRNHFEIVLHGIGLQTPPHELLEALGNAAISEVGIEPFPETRRTLERLRERGLRLGIVSDAWPSLESKYVKLGLRDFFDVFTISSRIACCKPDVRIYRTAIDEMQIPPQNLMFVDDLSCNVRAAIDFGMHGVLIDRLGKETADDPIERISNLDQLTDLLDAALEDSN